MPKCDFNRVALLCNLIEISLRYGYSPVNVLYIFRTPFPKNTSGGLLLQYVYLQMWFEHQVLSFLLVLLFFKGFIYS